MHKEIHFKNIANGTKSKTVIDNGQFAVMNNGLLNGKIVAPGSTDEERQALMVSFGAYVYTPDNDKTPTVNEENVQIADKDNAVYSKVTYLDIILEKETSTDVFDYYKTEIVAEDETIRYYFEVRKDGETVIYNRRGVFYDLREQYQFAIVPGFETPDWANILTIISLR